MTVKFEALPVIKLEPESAVMEPQHLPEVLHIDDPALDIMVDFKVAKPITIDADASIDQANEEMKALDEHLLIVVDKERKVVGIVGAEDLLGEKPIQIMQERRIARAEVPVKAVMRKQDYVIALDIEELRHAKVGNILHTLKKQQRHYAIVVQITNGQQMVCGYFSAPQMSKSLHMNVMDFLTSAQTVAELQKRHT